MRLTRQNAAVAVVTLQSVKLVILSSAAYMTCYQRLQYIFESGRLIFNQEFAKGRISTMGWSNATLWFCSLAGLLCSAVPDVSIVQTAYEREASSGSSLHDKGLKVLKTKCHDDAGGRFLCEVMFVSNDDPAERLYFDIIAVARTPDGWTLQSGLCKR
jgi:hypothetical protein